jgi:hypothetical protein
LDAAVNGGIQNYKKAFLNEKFLDEHPELGDLIEGFIQILL